MHMHQCEGGVLAEVAARGSRADVVDIPVSVKKQLL